MKVECAKWETKELKLLAQLEMWQAEKFTGEAGSHIDLSGKT